jgi:rhodanese-related sulfurtransferase
VNLISITFAQSYNNISVGAAHDMIEDKILYPNLIILDVREQWEYDENHLCDSILIPTSEINARIDELEPYKDSEIIVYCSSGSRSTQASQNLADNHNFTKIYNMQGGIVAWISAGYEVCDSQSQPSISFSGVFFLVSFIPITFITGFLITKKLIIKKKEFDD